ncbi:isopentenyl-diphosphate Delta-isomerase [Tumidithrix elongata RA019]|uniref:Isopentenyl-diphosphate delta-isomerase n=1 Tax=Tumidithrix elongata BACA0141 TaxID=2716417 RepID=A0AAW9Q0G8_9CYAN|nr:isopentenyl-diphosphate Delta-isomerase [Tumidithrix elongata RA019]
MLQAQATEELLILVDESDRQVGVAEKLQAHLDGKLHRAFSIFVMNSQGELLLQKRAKAKYHSGGLWTNTCCSHPRPNETLESACDRRLQEEMGFSCQLKALFSFVYHANLDRGLIEHEYDHVFLGNYEGSPTPNPEEVEDWQWMGLEALQIDIRQNPQHYTYWLRECLDRFLEIAGNHKGIIPMGN